MRDLPNRTTTGERGAIGGTGATTDPGLVAMPGPRRARPELEFAPREAIARLTAERDRLAEMHESALRKAREAEARARSTEATLDRARRVLSHYARIVPRARWLAGHAWRKLRGRGVPILYGDHDVEALLAGGTPAHAVRPEAELPTTPAGFDSRLVLVARQAIEDNRPYEPDLATSVKFRDPGALLWASSIGASPAQKAWRALYASLDQAYTHVIFVPWLKRGGADLAAVNVARAAIENDETTLVIVTDYGDVSALPWLPEKCALRVLSELDPNLSIDERAALVRMLVVALRPTAVLNINSRACWMAIDQFGRGLSQHSNLYAALFCYDYLPDGTPSGYAASQFRSCIDAMTRVYVDNVQFAQQLVDDYGLPPSLSRRMTVLRQPVPQTTASTINGSMRAVNGPVLWAGRFSRQKNIPLLLAIARQMPECEFHVFGEGEPYHRQQLEEFGKTHSNLKLKGEFASFERLPLADYSALLFTSLWEGLPTTLILAGHAGIPIIATGVGGVPELVTDSTGWLVRDTDAPEPYVRALREVRSAPGEARRRTLAMREKVARQHAWGAFVDDLKRPGDFLSSARRPGEFR